MRVIRYTGAADERIFSEADLASVGQRHAGGLTIVKSVDAKAIVNNKLADYLIGTGEFSLVGSMEDSEEEVEAQRAEEEARAAAEAEAEANAADPFQDGPDSNAAVARAATEALPTDSDASGASDNNEGSATSATTKKGTKKSG